MENEDILLQEIEGDEYNDPLHSWLQFNTRVLNEAKRESNPILERLQFLGITDSNLDEFIRTKFRDFKGYKSEISELTADIENTYLQLTDELYNKYKIRISSIDDIRDSKLLVEAKKIFKNKIFPLLQPLMLSDSLPIPDISDDTGFLLSKIETEDGNELTSILALPKNELMEISKNVYCLNTDLIREFTPLIYRGQKILWTKMFRVFRKIDSLSTDKESDYLTSIKEQLKKREKNRIVYYDTDSNIVDIESVIGNAKKRKRKYPYGLSFLKSIKDSLDDYSDDMVYKKYKPTSPINKDESIFDQIDRSDIIVHYPYDDFKLTAVRFLEEAAFDPKVNHIYLYL